VKFFVVDSGIFSCSEGANVEQVARISKHIFVFAFGYLSTLLSFISCIANIVHTYMLDIVYVLALSLVQESY